jgi:putative heme-binding domain-containing protein
VKATLKAGKNLLVVRCGNAGGGWQFSAAVAGERAGKLFETKPAAAPSDRPTRDAYGAFAVSHPGDPAKGKAVFMNVQTAGCIKCHQLSPTEGGIVGPSLAGVGGKYNKAQLIESILYPSKQILDGYQQTEVRTKDGDVVAGVVKAETDADVTLYDASAQKIVVKKSEIKSRKVSQLSVMPEGLEQALSQQEFTDVVAFLESLKEQPAK